MLKKIKAIWHQAITHPWSAPAVWFHGDMSLGNILIKKNKLAAIIDFGCSAIGDPACDFSLAWSLFDKPSRFVFKQHIQQDQYCWNRGKAWALWKALIIFSGIDPNQADRHKVENIINNIINDDV